MTGKEDVDGVYASISLCGLSIVYKYYCIFCIALTYFVIKNTKHFIIRALSPFARSTFLEYKLQALACGLPEYE